MKLRHYGALQIYYYYCGKHARQITMLVYCLCSFGYFDCSVFSGFAPLLCGRYISLKSIAKTVGDSVFKG